MLRAGVLLVVCVAATLGLQNTSSWAVPSVRLFNACQPGQRMPATGLGTGWYFNTPNDEQTAQAVELWLRAGGGRVDTANSYRTQRGIGIGMKRSGIPRDQIFITSKIDNARLGYEDTLEQLNQILTELDTPYVDMLMIHWPGGGFSRSRDPVCQNGNAQFNPVLCRQRTWQALEVAFRDKRAHAIGVSNFVRRHMEDIAALGGELPSVNQVEFHPYWNEQDLLDYCKERNVVFNGYSPYGAPDFMARQGRWPVPLLRAEPVLAVARETNRNPSEVLAAWSWQQGVIINPRTLQQTHMARNIGFFDLTLSTAQMARISAVQRPASPKVCPDPSQIASAVNVTASEQE